MTQPPTSLTHGQHLPVLDGIRGLAILLVMFMHFFHGVTKGSAMVDDVVFGLAYRGWIGVDLFFVLSGFLITGILLDAKGGQHYFRNFYARRVLRIFPAYYFILLVIFVILPRTEFAGYVADSLPDQGWHWSYLSNFRVAHRGEFYVHHVPNVFWSLAIEEQFYLVWPLVVWMCSRRALMLVCVALGVLAVLLRFVLVIWFDVGSVPIFVMTPTRLDGLAVGALLALVLRSGVDLRQTRKWTVVLGIASAVGFALLTLHRPPGWEELPIQSLRFSCLAVFFGAALWLSVTADGGALVRLFNNRFLVVLGKYAYALYLWHGPIDRLMLACFDPDDTGLILGSRLPVQLPYFAVGVALSLLAAWLSWHLLERHALALKRFFVAPVRPPKG